MGATNGKRTRKGTELAERAGQCGLLPGRIDHGGREGGFAVTEHWIILEFVGFQLGHRVYFSERSSGPGFRREPATDLGAVANVFIAESAVEVGFLVENHEELEAGSGKEGVENQQPRLIKYHPACDDGEDADVHGIAGVTVESAHHELFRGINGSGSAASEGCEIPEAPESIRGHPKRRRGAIQNGPEGRG